MLFFYNLSLVSLIYRAPTGEPKWGEGRNFFSLSIPVRKFLEGGPLPEVETLKGDPPWPGIWQKGTSTSGNMVSEFLGRGLQKTAGSEPSKTCSELGWWSLRSKPWGPWTWGPHVSKCDSNKATPQSRATLFGHFSQSSDTLLRTCQARFSLEWPPNIFNFQNYKKVF